MLHEKSMKVTLSRDRDHLPSAAPVLISAPKRRTNTKAQWRSPLQWRILVSWTAAKLRFHSTFLADPRVLTGEEGSCGIRRRQPRRMRQEIYESYKFTCI